MLALEKNLIEKLDMLEKDYSEEFKSREESGKQVKRFTSACIDLIHGAGYRVPEIVLNHVEHYFGNRMTSETYATMIHKIKRCFVNYIEEAHNEYVDSLIDECLR